MIELKHATRRFELGGETVHALHDVSLDLEQGEYVSVMGPSGSGKSTLLNMLGLLDSLDEGEYLLAGHPTFDLGEEGRARLRREYIGFVFQSYHLIPRMTARENIELPLILEGMPPRQRATHVDEALERLMLTERAKHLPGQLSGGQRQRVAIGRAIVTHPRVLLADEPTGNLDSDSGAEVIHLLESLNDSGITLMIVTHDLDTGNRARRRIRMRDGKIVEDLQGSVSGASSDALV